MGAVVVVVVVVGAEGAAVVMLGRAVAVRLEGNGHGPRLQSEDGCNDHTALAPNPGSDDQSVALSRQWWWQEQQSGGWVLGFVLKLLCPSRLLD